MRKQIEAALVATGLTLGLAISPIAAQTADDSKMSGKKMSGKGMSHKDQMDMMDKMSAEEKAATFDKMSAKDRMAAMKMAGHDMSKMSSQESMAMEDKMTAQEKADMFDKIPMEKRMSMMHKDSGKSMDRMDKMQNTPKP